MASGIIKAQRESRGRLSGTTSYTLTVPQGSLNFFFIGTSVSSYMYAGIIYTVSTGNTGHFDIAKGASVDIATGNLQITVNFTTTASTITAYYLSIPINGGTISL